jgi:hypothetical protein
LSPDPFEDEDEEGMDHEHNFRTGKRVSDLMHMAHGIIMKNTNPKNETVSIDIEIER